MRYVDLTHTFSASMPVYPGDSKSEIGSVATITRQGFADQRMTTTMHVGTHLDAPGHMVSDGARVSELDVARFFGRGRLIDARGQTAIGAELLSGVSLVAGDIVLVMTGQSEQYHQPLYFERYPEVTMEFAKQLVALKVNTLGLDTPSPDRPPFSVHKLLLGQGVLIIENLTNLEQLVGVKDFEVVALPAKFDADGATVRAVAQW